VDDFGTGFASIGQLMELPVTGIKLDRSLVSQMLTDRRKSSLCRGCVEMAHGLGLEVTAVGIENQDDLMLVAAMGCDFAQGDFLGPAGALETVAPSIEPPQRPQRGSSRQREQGTPVPAADCFGAPRGNAPH
ncbi:MAG: EAL domain-containing protein, partial [Alphaproteobacteria bacterium]